MQTVYRYKAISAEGQKVSGRLQAASRRDAALKLENGNLYPLTIIAENNLWRVLTRLKALKPALSGHNRCTSRDLMIFCRQLSTMLQAGIPVLQALNNLAAHLNNKVFQNHLRAVALKIENGAAFNEALAGQEGYFPPFLVSMVEAGESAGVLDLMMERCAEHYEKQHDLEEKIRSATTYPLFVALVALFVIAVMVIFVLPRFAQIFSQMGLKLPFFSRALLGLGQFALENPLWLMLSLVLIGFLPLLFFNTKKGRLKADHLKFKLPVFSGIYQKIVAARFARTMSTLAASGISLHQALQITDRIINNARASYCLEAIKVALEQGEPLFGPLFTSEVFPPLLAEMVRTGEATGTLDLTLEKTAVYYEKEVAYSVERLGAVLEPILLLVAGLFTGLIVFSVLSPMYSIFEML